MLAETKQWNEVIIVGNGQGPLYDNHRTEETPGDLPPLDYLDWNTLVIFDECFTPSRSKEDRMVMHEFSVRGRMRGISTIFVESDLLRIPKVVRWNADVLYLTTDPHPRGWKEIKWLLCANAPIAECFAALSRPNRWFKIGMRNNKTEEIDPPERILCAKQHASKADTNEYTMWTEVLGQMKHLGYKNWDCGCKRNAATAVMTRNYHS